jgi:hypothetical protein
VIFPCCEAGGPVADLALRLGWLLPEKGAVCGEGKKEQLGAIRSAWALQLTGAISNVGGISLEATRPHTHSTEYGAVDRESFDSPHFPRLYPNEERCKYQTKPWGYRVFSVTLVFSNGCAYVHRTWDPNRAAVAGCRRPVGRLNTASSRILPVRKPTELSRTGRRALSPVGCVAYLSEGLILSLSVFCESLLSEEIKHGARAGRLPGKAWLCCRGGR